MPESNQLDHDGPKDTGSGTFVLIGYCNDAVFLQQAFILVFTSGLLEIVFAATRWRDGMPSGMEYVRYAVEVSRHRDDLVITSKAADVEFRLNLVLHTGSFHTGLAAYSSGSSGALNKQCVQDFVQYYLSHAELENAEK